MKKAIEMVAIKSFWSVAKPVAMGWILLECLAATSCAAQYPVTLSRDQIIQKMKSLKPLPKIHYSFPLDYLLGKNDTEILYELSRITHSLCISGVTANDKNIKTIVDISNQVNAAHPAIVSSIGINFSPFHHKFKKDLPPTDRGESYQEELNYIKDRLDYIKTTLRQYNNMYKSNVQVTAVLLDSERLSYIPGNLSSNQAMCEALDTVHKLVQGAFPEARIEWYARGMRMTFNKTGWERSYRFTGNEIMPDLSCSLYSLPELERMREAYRKTCQLADSLKVKEVTPWVALASGYRRGIEKQLRWDTDWDYDIIYSYLAGQELNIPWYGEQEERIAPYNRAKVIVFYPPPFDPRTKQWPKHFIAYVRGATGDKNLEDLGYTEN